ncbi:hypothetical protein EON65_01940 [archaeon]|nr:MAG: hypothetical protein EON65_01940 [archaeon]
MKNPKVNHEPGFKFGSPSTRYPVVAENIDEEHGEEDSHVDAEEEDGYEGEDNEEYDDNGENYYDNPEEGYDENIDRHTQHVGGKYKEDHPI